MSHRVNKIRKRIAKRRRVNNRIKDRPGELSHNIADYYAEEDQTIYEPKTTFHPLWNREAFLFKILSSIALVLVVGILFQSPSPVFEEARSMVKSTMEKEFQFAAVTDWYENQFGKPLALFPESKEDPSNQLAKEADYALPVGAKISEGFSQDGRGVMIETDSGAEITSMADGVVVFAGKKDDLGQAVIIQHADHSESWYGKLDQITVKTHEHIKGGQVIGTVSSEAEQNTGEYYFAIKKEDAFIDPIQVIDLE